MYHLFNIRTRAFLLICLVFAFGLLLSKPSFAAATKAVDLAQSPLAKSSDLVVKPNVMFILDDSGSMDWNYLPDWTNDSLCKGTSGAYSSACDKQPPFRSSDFNSMYYNPAITYIPAVNSTGAKVNTSGDSKGNQTTWTSVKNDAYNIQSTSSTNLVTSYTDVEWCTDSTYTDCLRNDNYILPGTVNGKAYTRSHTGMFGTGTGSVATGSIDAPTTASRTFGPHYYKITPGEYCDSPQLTNCQESQAGSFTYPAKVRWCKATAASGTTPARTAEQNATTAQPAAGACKATRQNGVYDAIRYPSKFFKPATAAVAAVAYSAAVPAVLPTPFIPAVPATPGSPAIPEVLAVPGVPAVAPANGTIRMTAVTRNNSISIRCGGTYIGQSASFNSSNSNTASTRLNALYTSFNVTTVNGYTMTCTKSPNTLAPTSVTCSVVAPAGVSACSGGFNIDSDITVTQNTGPSGGSNAVAAIPYSPAVPAVLPTPFIPAVPATPGSPAIPEVLAQPAIPAQPAHYPGSFTRVDIVGTSSTYPKVANSDGVKGRSDCAADPCTYAEEMTNFANWWTYYQTRMQAMKTSVSLAFEDIDENFRVGFTTISYTGATNGTLFQQIDFFNPAQRLTWYKRLLESNPTSTTPLRAALSKVGRIYGKKISGQADPIQYSCQQNFAILSTDGYWNTNLESSSYGPYGLTGANVGNQDAAASFSAPYSEGSTAVSDTLADVAAYFYNTDLRVGAKTDSQCKTASGEILCDTPVSGLDKYNNVFTNSNDTKITQHMVTFTLGLGLDGTLSFDSDYLKGKSPDYNSLFTAATRWSDPIANAEEERIDDLWHAAVNGHGIYFSAKKPDDIIGGLKTALQSIGAVKGAGAAAATSTLNPVAGDNFAYVASYTTVDWTGNLEARTINTTSGVVSPDAFWCVETIKDKNGVAVCTGKMPAQVAAGTRKIWTKNDTTNSLNNFNSSNTDLTPYFTGTKLANLSQWSSLSSGTTSQQTDAVTNIVNYLRGDKTYEGILFRERAATFGDAVESQPAFIGKPTFNYVDAGYGTFKSDNATRIGMVYIGANDGMMHAFYAKDEVTPPTGTKCVVGGGTYCGGEEAWAYVPSMVIPHMFELADTDYANEHMYYANGSPVISDVYDPVGAKWRTILVAGLNAGGRGYYALDITKPKEPILLWEFTPANDDDLGFTYGKPVITKKSSGDWVVLVTSGYNNVPDVSPRVKYPQYTTHGDGVGYLYVLDAIKGPTATFGKISTGEGTTSIPSGLAQINAWAEEAEKNNTATYTYGGDLLGNVWRFDINDGSSGSMMKFAKLLDNTTPTKAGQPITTRPELGKVLTSDGKTHRVVFVGTGKYLEGDDLADKQLQTLYAIKDDNNTLTPDPFLDPRTQTTLMVQQTMVNDSANASRSIPNPANPAADFINGRGWFIDFTDPTGGERQNVASQLVLGTLLVPTTVPSNTACAPGGTSWLNFFDYRTGAAVIGSDGKQVSTKFDAPIVGINVIYIPDPTTGKPTPKVSVVTADNPTPQIVSNAPFSASGSGFQKKRVIWRELINE